MLEMDDKTIRDRRRLNTVSSGPCCHICSRVCASYFGSSKFDLPYMWWIYSLSFIVNSKHYIYWRPPIHWHQA